MTPSDTPGADSSEQRPPVPEPEPGTDEAAAPQEQDFAHDGAEHYPTEENPA